MALPNMVVTGNLKEILGTPLESPMSRARILFTSSVPSDVFVTWEGSLHRILSVPAVVNDNGAIVLDDGSESPVRLLAHADDLGVDDLQWTMHVALPSSVLPPLPAIRMRPIRFSAVGDGETLDLKTVA